MTQRSRARAAAPRPRARRAPAIVAAVAVLAAILLLAAWWLRRPVPAPAAAPPDPSAGLGAREALDRAVVIAQGGRYARSLPYFRRAALEGTGWLVHWNYAAALNNASIEVRRRGPLVVPTTRSAVERVALVREALGQVTAAESAAPDNRGRARLRVVRGRTLELWGFPIEALAAYREALAMDTTCAPAREAEAKVRAELQGATQH